MISPYLLRLLCLCLASFFLVHAALGLATRIAAPAAIRLAERMRPRLATRLLLALRMFPLALAVFIVVGLCVPSYLWLEPGATAERVGFACSAAVLLGVAVWGISIARVLRATAASLRYTRHCQRLGRQTRVPGEPSPVLVVEGEAPLLALAGVIRSQLVISQSVLRALSGEQLDAALRHERAHRTSRDNLKRLFLLAAPDILPFSRGFADLERGWARFSEWAADDRAIEGDGRRSLSLAAALVRVARLGAPPRPSPFLASLVADGSDLSARVDRLLRAKPPQEKPLSGMRALVGSAALLMVGLLVAAMLRPATLYSVHRLLEHLVR